MKQSVCKIVQCGHCGYPIASYADGKGTPKLYCDRICRNKAKKARRASRPAKEKK